MPCARRTGALAITSTHEELRTPSSGHLFMVRVARACSSAGAFGAVESLDVLWG